MDEIIPGLWVGDMSSALDVENLKSHNIFSILSAMRGRVTVHETFIRHQILLDDTEEADVLVHFLPSITFIQAELDKGRGVLVHCQAGMSRSVTIVAAYLMYTKKLDPESALNLIRQARPNIDPNTGFLVQLEIFHKSSFKFSRQEKSTRLFYMDRATEEMMNGDGSLPDTGMFAKFPRTPSDSVPSSPGGPRRRIRCKMCRQELATREHMLDHGQLGPATPAANTPAGSRRTSMHAMQPLSRRPSQPRSRLGSQGNARRPSGLGFGGLGDTLSMSSAGKDEDPTPTARPFVNISRSMLESSLVSALDSDDESDDEEAATIMAEKARQLGRRMSDAVTASDSNAVKEDLAPGSSYSTPDDDLAAQLYANPKLAALRSTSIVIPRSGDASPSSLRSPLLFPMSPPILMNPKCSGYFVEPMAWMEEFLESGQIAGKIMCPNTKCQAKLGNYDWAGMCCGCKQWVTPGFCINRSKVDEVV